MLLLTPGPTPVPEHIRKAMADVTLHHRTEEFESIFAKAREKTLKLFNMPEVLFLASSGTGAMEACITNLSQKRVLAINSGKFGERFGKIATAFKKDPIVISYEWDTPANIEDIEKVLKENNDIDCFCIQACESAGGLRHPFEEIAKKIKSINSEIMVIVDGITAVGVEKIDVSNIDALITGSQKALMLPPGLAIIGLSENAVKKIESCASGYYFNLKNELKSQRKNTTAYTAATTLIIGLNAILNDIDKLTQERFFEQTAKRHYATQEALKAIGLNIYPKSPAKAMITIAHEKANEIRSILKNEYCVNIAGGQDHLNGKIFRINNMGFVQNYELSWAINSIEMALEKINERSFDGTANKIFIKEMV